jgi:hypothetical protein
VKRNLKRERRFPDTRRFSRLVISTLVGAALAAGLISCSTLPESKFKSYTFPEGSVFVDEKPTRRFKIVGPVRVRVNFSSLNPEREEQELCRNYYNKGAKDLLKRAKRDLKADAVIEVRSIVYFMDGKSTRYSTPECADDGNEGQILLEGKAIRYLPDPKPSESPER